jgi:beta-lactamase regulating signal transducer with metallopeptidase domain
MLRLSLDFALRALMIAAATAAVLRILNVRTPAARHTAWTGVLAAMLLLPAWTAWGPRIPLPLLPPLNEPTSYAVAPSFDPAPLPLASPSHATWNWTSALLVMYLAGASLFLIRLLAGAIQTRSLIRRAQARDGHLFSASCATPVTLGWLRPVVLLPANAEQWSSAQLDAVLTHERQHARRRDPLVQLLALINRALFWFHPLAWWLERHLAALAEEACDAAVLARGHDPHDYSRFLISLARTLSANGARLRILGTTLPGAGLDRRIACILERAPLPRITRTRLAALAAACLAVSVTLASTTIGRRPSAPTIGLQLAQVPGTPAQEPEQRRPEPLLRLRVIGLPSAAEQELRTRLRLQEGQPIRESDFQRAREVVHDFDPNLRLGRTWVNVNTPGHGIWLTVSSPEGGPASDDPLAKVPRRLHLAFEGIPDAEAESLRQKLAVDENQPLDPDALHKELARIHQIVAEFDPHLSDKRIMSKARRYVGPDGKPLIPDVIDLTLVISSGSSEGGTASDNLQANIPRRLHIAFERIPDGEAEELRQRLAVNEDQPLDPDALHKELARIQQIVAALDSQLNASRMTGKLPHNLGPDGKLLIPDVIDVTLVISPGNNAGTPMEQFARFQRVKSLEDKPLKLLLRILGLSSDQTADLRNRLQTPEGQIVDAATYRQITAHVREFLQDFTPPLNHDVSFTLVARPGPDGNPLPPEALSATILIQPAEAGAKTR